MATYYIDQTNETANLNGTWTSTGAICEGVGGNALVMTTGDYVRIFGVGKVWYRILDLSGNDKFTINTSPASTGLAEGFAASTLAYWDSSTESGESTVSAFCSYDAFNVHTVMTGGDTVYYRGGQTEYLLTAYFSLITTAATDVATVTRSLVDYTGTIWGDANPGWTSILIPQKRVSAGIFGGFGVAGNMHFKGYRIDTYDVPSPDNRTRYSLLGSPYYALVESCFIDKTGGSVGDGGILTFGESIQAGGWDFWKCTFNVAASNVIYIGTVNRGFRGSPKFRECNFHGTGIAVVANGGCGGLIFNNCTFGYDVSGTSKAVLAICNLVGGTVRVTNCLVNGTEEADVDSLFQEHTPVFIENSNRVEGDSKVIYNNGIVYSESGVTRTGGGNISLKVEPNSYVTAGFPLTVYPDIFHNLVQIDPASQTVTIYVQSYGYVTKPDASSLYVEFNYMGTTGTSTRSTVVSSAVIATNSSWYAFSSPVITGAQTGALYWSLFLKRYEANAGLYVDPVPVIATA